MSGYYSLLKKLRDIGENGGFVGRVHCSRSHLNSMKLVASREVDAAAIDSNALRIKLGSDLELKERLRVIET